MCAAQWRLAASAHKGVNAKHTQVSPDCVGALEKEAAEQLPTSYAHKANLQVIQTQDTIRGAWLGVKT